MKDKHLSGIIYGVISALAVTGYVSINKFVYQNYDVSAIEYTILFAITGSLFGGVSLRTKYTKQVGILIHKNLKALLTLGIAVGLAVGILVFGQHYTSSVNASILITSTIVATTLFSYALLNERLLRQQLIWMVVLFMGLYLAIVGINGVSFKLGDLIILSSVLFFGFGNAYSRVVMKKMKRPDIVPDIRLIIAGLAGILLAPFFINNYALLIELAPLSLLAGSFYFICMQTFAKSVYLLNANEAIVINQGQVFSTAIVGVLVLSESYTIEKFLGSLIVLTSIYHISTHRRLPRSSRKK